MPPSYIIALPPLSGLLLVTGFLPFMVVQDTPPLSLRKTMSVLLAI